MGRGFSSPLQEPNSLPAAEQRVRTTDFNARQSKLPLLEHVSSSTSVDDYPIVIHPGDLQVYMDDPAPQAEAADMEAAGVFDRARALNAALPVARLRRALQLYRTWINVGGFDGGFAVSRHELAIALELPSDRDPRVEFLFRTFAVEPAPGQLRVDLVTLLTTAALLSQGSLEDKAALVFSLVDLDTEDDVAEHELALVISSCTDGLERLGVVSRAERVPETDAVAIAYEAFEFVGVDVGDKMNFSSFMKWLTFHPRPQALMDRVSCIFSMSDLAKQMKEALQSHERLADEDPLRYYNRVHFATSNDLAEHVQVIAGPIIGKVTETTVVILLETDSDALVKFFAFPDKRTTKKTVKLRVQECRLTALEPLVVTITGLSPGTTYSFRLLGVCRSEREKCIASAATFPERFANETASDGTHKLSAAVERQLSIKFVNHRGDTSALSSDSAKQLHVPVDLNAGPTVTVHYGTIRIARPQLVKILQCIQRGQDRETLEATVCDILKECFRGSFIQARSNSLFRSSANYLADSTVDVIGELTSLTKVHPQHLSMLETLSRRVWSMYIGALWGQDGDVSAFDLSGIAVLIHCRCSTATMTADTATAIAKQIALNVKALPLVSNVIIVTDNPLTPDSTKSTQAAFDEAMESTDASRWNLLQSVVELNKAELATKMYLATFTLSGGYQTAISIKDTKVGINQLVCGPSNKVYNARMADHQEQNRVKLSSAVVTVQHSKWEHRPHIGQVTCSYKINRATNTRLGAAASSRMALVSLLPTLQPELTLGPVVGFVSHSSTKILIETNCDIEVDCVLTGRLVGDIKINRQYARSHEPAIFVFDGLRPGSVYDISFPGMAPVIDGATAQTLFKRSPAFRLTALSDDPVFDVSISKWRADCDASSFLHDVSSHILNPAIDLQSDLVLHLGCIASITQTFSSLLKLWSATISGDQRRTKFVTAVRECVRHHWNLNENRCVLSRGSHYFSSVGVARALLTRHDVPLGVLRDICAILRDYERVGKGNSSDIIPAERIALRMQRGAVLLALDTMETVMNHSATNPFAQFPDTLVSKWQWEALEYWFGGTLSVDIDSEVKAYVVVCDLPLWDGIKGLDAMLPAAASWSEHQNDLLRLLGLIFHRLSLNSTSCVIVIASGPTSYRSLVTETSTGLTFQHVVIGPVSQSSAPLSDAAPAHGPIRIGSRYTIEFEASPDRVESPSSCHYSTVDIVPHHLGAEALVRQYANNRPAASLIVGPVVGRVTTRTARILIELDRQAGNLICALVDSASRQRVTVEANVKAFTPTVLKIEGLRPGTRYHIEFDGILKNEGDEVISGYVNTPPQSPLATEWLVVNDNAAPQLFLHHDIATELKSDEASYWHRIITPGMRAFTARASSTTSHKNGDTLGNRDDTSHRHFNPWHYIHGELMSDPLINPQLLVHLGGQIDMQQAFASDELVELVRRISPLQELGGGLADKQVDSELEQIRHYVRHRMQEVYRVYWSAPPMRTALSQASNCMLLNIATDVYFTSAASLRSLLVESNIAGALELEEAALHAAANVLLGVAFELWQLYQNQLWVDLLERDLEFGNRSSMTKLAFTSTYGLSRFVFMNTNPEVYAYCSNVMDNKPAKGSKNDPPGGVNLFSTATWKVLDEALETTGASSSSSKQASKTTIQQLVVVVSADLVQWGGTNLYPDLRPHIIRVLETVFAWKQRDSEQREVLLIGRSATGSSMSYAIADEKTNAKIRLLAVGSISRPQEFVKTAKRTQSVKTPSTVAGHFSKRFTYQAVLTVAADVNAREPNLVSKALTQVSSAAARKPETPALYRTFASFQHLTDLRRGFLSDNLLFFPPKTPPKVIVGPVLGKMTVYHVRSAIPSEVDVAAITPDEDDQPKQLLCLVALPLLLEVDSDARVTCIVSDALAYQEIRVTEMLTRNVPHIFTITSLLPERRYVYRFEGVVNADNRRGSFHTPPPYTSLAPTNFICTSSNFPDHLEGSTDSMWAPIRERIALPWSGIDFVVHIGGQVPLHEAVTECVEWVKRELRLNRRRRPSVTGVGDAQSELSRLREQVRKRMQQHYRRAWNLPNVREVLGSCSNWFLRSQADVAPFFGTNYLGDLDDATVVSFTSQAARIVLEEAKRVVADYQLALMQDVSLMDEVLIDGLVTADKIVDASSEVDNAATPTVENGPSPTPSGGETSDPEQSHSSNELETPPVQSQPQLKAESDNTDVESCTAQVVQHGNTTFFVCDIRSARRDDVVTCNGRLQKPLARQERAIISERQWELLENALKVKKTHAFVLLLELPLILTSAEHVDKMREEQRMKSQQAPKSGGWNLYDLLELAQHWVSCRRQLEQLLHVLFRWKLKRRGRDVLIVSGAMRIGIDSLVRDAQSGLSLRSVSVGPITARVEQFLLPVSGTACPEFLPKAAPSVSGKSKKTSDSRFTFTHSLIAKRNYVLAQIVTQQADPGHTESEGGDDGSSIANDSLSSLISASFVSALDADPAQNPNGLAISASAHPVDMYRRPPTWWKRYIPMGRFVFWDDTVSLRAASDNEMQALSSFIEEDRALASALEVCYDKYQFAEAVRLEELRSVHARQRLDLVASLQRVFTELWRLVPDQKRRRMAYILDAYVSDLLLDHIRASDPAMASFLDGGAVEFNAFARLCRSVLWSACLLRLSVTLYEEDQLTDARQRWKLQKQQTRDQGAAAGLQPTNSGPGLTAEKSKEKRKQEKLERKRVERLREAEEELAIAREQQWLNRLADSGAAADAEEFARASATLETRMRALDETKKQREAEREMRGERKQRKREAGDRGVDDKTKNPPPPPSS